MRSLIAKILRSTPVGKIYILIKPKSKEVALNRLTTKFCGLTEFFYTHGKYSEMIGRKSKKSCLISFEIDVTKIDWRKYLQEIHIPGLIKYIFNNHKNMSE
ncbi:uncharacterized protein [Primulina eburnea]|uniref:uncharacterized protein n=1 Tax=Primulina eburnea TaxID=1245227 RepID=UPI003C6C9AC5